VTALLRSDGSAGGPALALRPWDVRDIPDLLAIYRDPVMRATSKNLLRTDQDVRDWLARHDQHRKDGSRLSFAVLNADGPDAGHVLGGVVLKGHQAGQGTAEVGYWTAAAARNRGVASQAVQILTTWAFEILRPDGLRRIDLLHQEDNPASCGVARKAGYALVRMLPASPPDFPLAGHLHSRPAPA
jgi:RimJ/RimL family protein N-acetyltransferase